MKTKETYSANYSAFDHNLNNTMYSMYSERIQLRLIPEGKVVG